MAQSSLHSPRAPTPLRRLSLTTHLEAPWTQQSTFLKVKTKPSPFLKNSCCSHCSTHRHLECSCRKVKISPCRKFLEGSWCPEAQPLLRPEKKQRQHRHLFSRTATASQNRKQDPEAAEALVSCEGFLGRLWSDEPFTLHFWGKMVGLGPHFNQDPTMKPAEDLNGVVGISWLLVTPTQLTSVLILEPCGN